MRSREFFDPNGGTMESLDADLPKHRAELLEAGVESPRFKEYLDSIDLEAIRLSFVSLAKNTNLEADSINFLKRDEIILTSDQGSVAGAYSPVENLITINVAALESRAESVGIPEKLFLLDTVTHEQIHAWSKLVCRGDLEIDKLSDGELMVQTGYGYQFVNKQEGVETITEAFTLFDEGVTELLSRKTVANYLKSHPEYADAAEIEHYLQMMDSDNVALPYNIPVTFVEAFIEKIAHETQVSTDTVWGAIIRGKLEGEDLNDSEFRKAAEEIIGPKIIPKLSDLNESYNDFGFAKLVDLMDIKSINPALWTKMQNKIDAASRARQSHKSAIN